VHVEIAAPPAEQSAEVRSALRRQLERLEGVQWATVNDVVGRVLVAVDTRRVGVEDVVGVVTAVEQARGGTQVFPLRTDHPADLEPFLAAVADAAVDVAALGVALAAKYSPIPALTRHATLLVTAIDSQRWIRTALVERFGDAADVQAALAEVGTLLDAMDAIVENKFSKAGTMIANGADEFRSNLGKARGSIARARHAEQLQLMDAGSEDEVLSIVR
jgi:cation-transporting ATPase I